MKTTLKNLAITESLATYFKESYSVKMGGTQTVEFPCGTKFFFDDKEYYSGRGAKYNSSINHQNLGFVLVTKKQLIDYVNRLNEVARIKKENAKIAKLENLKIKEATKNGVYC